MKKCALLLLVMLLVCAMTVPAQASEAAENVAAMIAALPSVEEFAAMDPGMQQDFYNRTQVAYDAWMSLSEEEKAEIPGAEETFAALFTYFNAQVMPIDQADAKPTGKRSFNSYGWILIAALAAVVPVLGRKRKTR